MILPQSFCHLPALNFPASFSASAYRAALRGANSKLAQFEQDFSCRHSIPHSIHDFAFSAFLCVSLRLSATSALNRFDPMFLSLCAYPKNAA
jgi:hypothetical protein